MMNTFDYIKCYEDTFWSWDSEERYVHIKDGITFAYWGEVTDYLNSLAPMGLPLFDVFMGVLAATNDNEFGSIRISVQKQLLPKFSEDTYVEDLKIFDTISEVDKKYKKGENRFALIAAILDKANVKLIGYVSTNIITDINDPEKDFFGNNVPKGPKHIKKVINCFKALNTYFPDAESIVEAMLGFDMEKLNMENIIPKNNDKSKPEGASLLEELQNEVLTEKMAALIPYVLSGMNFPIHSTQSDERPDGGVSDLSNKGHFDQLIVSEFAYDDDYFMSRIVNNEALFYQREKAKNENDNDLCILIDASLYMWGLPKLIATAVACTVGLKEEKVELDCFLVGSDLIQCDFRSIEGVLKGTRFADAAICPVEGIDALLQLERTYSNTLFITTEDSWKRPEMIPLKDTFFQWYDFLVFVNESAEIKIQKAKGKQLANFKLDLETIWELNKNNKRKRPAQVPSATPSEYPILFPRYNSRIKYHFEYREEMFFVDKSKGLFRFRPNQGQYGATKAATYVRKIGIGLDSLGDIGQNKQGELELLMFNRRDKVITIYNLTKNSEQNYEFPLWRSRMGTNFLHLKNEFHFVGTKGSWIINDSFAVNTIITPFNQDLFKESISRRKEIVKEFPSFQSYLKKVNLVFLSNQGELVIENKRIEAKSIDYFQFTEPPLGGIKYRPVYTRVGEQRTFTFNSGDILICEPHGVFEFRFSDMRGAEGFELILSKVGGHKLQTVTLVKEITGKGLKACKELVDQGAGSIQLSSNGDSLQAYAVRLRELGNNVEVKPLRLGNYFFMTATTGAPMALASNTFFTGSDIYKDDTLKDSQRKITALEFYDLYLKRFIENIQNGT